MNEKQRTLLDIIERFKLTCLLHDLSHPYNQPGGFLKYLNEDEKKILSEVTSNDVQFIPIALLQQTGDYYEQKSDEKH